MKFKASSHSQKGIALVITLIMLAITLVMAVAFLALAKRERSSVSTSTDTTTARLASDTAAANAEAQIIANVLGSFNGLGSSNAYNLSLLVSTNYINPYGFNPGIGNPTNVSYTYANGNPLSVADLEQNISNLWFLPRAPVFVPTNSAFTGYDFRYYLDLNQNGRYDTNYFGQDVDSLGQPLAGLPYLHTGDPEWIGVLEHPDAPHGPNNHFVSRYAFIAVPIGNTLDINYIHNQARTPNLTTSDGYMRNQGVGSWELNLAAFLADLNTNEWGAAVGSGLSSPPGSPLYYQYNEPQNLNSGRAFDDARALLRYRYNYAPLPNAGAVLFNAPLVFPYDQIDAYSDGPLQTTLDTNSDLSAPGVDGDIVPKTTSWSGANNVNYYFTLGDLLDTAKVGGGANSFPGRLANAGNAADTYDRYTYYRMLNQLGTDSTADDGKLDLNYSNAVVSYTTVNGTQVPLGINVVAGAETNLVPWAPQNFFNAAADRMLRTYSANWFQSSPSNFLVTYYGALPRGYLDATGMGVTNFPNYGVTNQVPAFGLTNIPVLINSNFVYSPAVNRLLQLAANLYDATTNGNFNLPHVFRPIFERDTVGNVFIVGYTNLFSSNGPNTVSGPGDPQLAAPHPISDLPFFITPYSPIHDATGLVNVYGVPWIIGAKKGLPNFNQFYMVNNAQVTRKLLISRTPTDPATATYTTNQMYSLGISNTLGVTFWNSYNNAYPRPVAIYAHDLLSEVLTNSTLSLGTARFDINGAVENSWPGSQWSGTIPNVVPNSASFVTANWSTNYLYNSITYVATNTPLAFPTILWTSPGLQPFTQVGLMITNYLQAYLLDGNNVIDYVQLRDPISVGNLNQALADPDYSQPNNIFYQWSVNSAAGGTPWGVANQLEVSGHPGSAPSAGGTWNTAPTPEGITTPAAEAAFYNGFFAPHYLGSDGQTYVNTERSIQAPYTPSRTVFSSFLLQANDPLVHYLSSDLNAQTGAVAVWNAKQSWQNGIWNHVDDLLNQPLPSQPGSPIGGRYQPWLQPGQMDRMSALNVVPVTNNYACKDPLVERPDNWDFPTNAYPSVGWIGRVHRGTPWQTIYLKDYDLTKAYNVAGRNILYVGTNTWANWTGDIQQNFGQYYDAANYAPVQDRLLFDIFTTRFNDNAAHGTLPVNQTGLAAWSAVFSGMVALSNSTPFVTASTTSLSYTNSIINPVGVINSALPISLQSPLWRIVNGPNGINATRANTNLFPYHAFTRVGDILATPALTTNLLNLGTQAWGYQQVNFGINDEEYEWLPQHMMGLVRMSAPRYVLYCLGQALRPAPNGTVLSGSYALLVTNYQVVAESAERVVIRVDNANSSTPHVVVESSNVLPPN